MMSVIPVEKSNAITMKQKLMSNDLVKEEARSFLNISRENLNISQADLEQGFNRSRLRPSRNTILSSLALVISILSLSLEGWRLQCSSTTEMKQLKRDVEGMKQLFLQQNLINELKAFEQQLYSEASTEDNNSSETDIDYDSNYNDDDDSASYDYSTDYHLTTDVSKSSDPSEDAPVSTSTSEPKKIANVSRGVRRAQMKRQEDSKKNTKEEHKAGFGQKIGNTNGTKRKRDIIAGDTVNTENSKEKRFAGNRKVANESSGTARYQHDNERRAKMDLNVSGESIIDDDFEEDQTSYTNERRETGTNRWKTNWHLKEGHFNDIARNASNRMHLLVKKDSKDLDRTLTRRNLRTPRQVRAVHYKADRTLFSMNDENAGNGKVRHSNGIFKAWRESDWVIDLGMDRFFSLTTDGTFTVYETGLYLVYAQIHYLDDHDENGFHLLVNNRPVLQCMVYSPGVGHKSRSCFSAQVIVLQSEDRLILEEVGSARYTLFHHDKSFFGLVKLGEARHQRRQNDTSRR